jgi:hypothetical protein
LFLLTYKRMKFIGIIGIVALVAFDLIRFGQKFTPFTDSSYFFPTTKILSYLSEQQKPFRVLALDDRVLPPNVSTYYGIETPAGYDPLYSKYFEEFVASNNGRKPLPIEYNFNRIVIPTLSESPLFPLFNIKYLVSLSEVRSQSVVLRMREGNTYLYEVIDPSPRAFFVNDVKYESDSQNLFKKMFTLDLRKIAVVSEMILFMNKTTDTEGVVEFTTYGDSFFSLQTNVESDKFLVVTNSYYPHWRAYIDGIPTHIFRTDNAFQGIIVPSGIHAVRFQYE